MSGKIRYTDEPLGNPRVVADFLPRSDTGVKFKGLYYRFTKEVWPMNMPGIEFLRDRKGRRKAVLIDLKKHKRLWEDLYDAYLAHSRRGERRESLALVRRLVEARAKRKTRG